MDEKSLMSSGWSMVTHNKRYIFWFWLLNLMLASFGVTAFSDRAHAILDHSLYSDRLLHGFDISVLIEMFARPEFGSPRGPTMVASFFMTLFLLATALFLPGVFLGYASNYRLPRDEFFRACGRNLWRFVRLLLIAGLVMGIVSGILFAAQGALVKKAGDSTNELLPFELQMITLAIIFLVMTAVRIWFDLAEVDIVLSDQNAVRRSIGAGFRHTYRALLRLLGSYVLITIFAALILVVGLWIWLRLVPSSSVIGAFVVGQFTLLLLLIPRFWQRGVAVAYYQQKMFVPVIRPEPIMSDVLPEQVISAPSPAPVIPVAVDPTPDVLPG